MVPLLITGCKVSTIHCACRVFLAAKPVLN
jgi:hypothetical protein